jgi:hypothetical protein
VLFGQPVKDSDRPGGDESQKVARFQERHYTVAEIAEIWNLSRDVVRKIFEGEPGVLVFGDDSSRSKRGYHTLRIPESVAERVHRRLCNPDLTPARARAYSSGKSGPPAGETASGP